MKNTINIHGSVYSIKSEEPRIRVDTWPESTAWATLKEGDEYVDESYKGSQYVVDDDWHAARMPMNIRFTGRTIQNIGYGFSQFVVRSSWSMMANHQISFVGLWKLKGLRDGICTL